MVLEDLHASIETLRNRITEHGPALGQSEALTRYALVDPLLRELGWDTSDPAQVGVEVRFGSGSADYALLGTDGKPRVIIEAKKLGTPLKNAVSQGIHYSIEDGILYFALTDGQHWELYETHRPVPLSQKLVMNLNVGGSIAETCLNALALWRPSVAFGNIEIGATPVANTLTPAVEVISTPEPLPQPPSPGEDWHTLAAFKPASGSKPASVRFPDGKSGETATWADFISVIVGWLRADRSLTASALPIRRGNSKLSIVSVTAIHPSGAPFRSSRQVGPWFINTHYSGKDHVQNAIAIISHAGLNPADFAVRLAK